MTSSLVGSEMCIRDRHRPECTAAHAKPPGREPGDELRLQGSSRRRYTVSYTHLTLPTICSV
eukprot:6130554-Prorocentrum_lima.AAC.1